MLTAHIRFYQELNFFLEPVKRKRTFKIQYAPRTTVKALIENLGVPHTEVDLILVGSISMDFNYLIQEGDRISVYPVFESFDISTLSKVRPQSLRVIKFVLDVHLGTLAVKLRMVGFDSKYQNDYPDEDLAKISKNENRILLTRDRGLLKRKLVTHGYCIKSKNVSEQLKEVIKRFDLASSFSPFTYCVKCNTSLKDITMQSIQDRVPQIVFQKYNNYKTCPNCNKIYWQGSHWQDMQRLLKSLKI